MESFFGPARRDQRVADDLIAALAGFRPQLLIDAAEAIPGFAKTWVPIDNPAAVAGAITKFVT